MAAVAIDAITVWAITALAGTLFWLTRRTGGKRRSGHTNIRRATSSCTNGVGHEDEHEDERHHEPSV